ncbi:GTPase 1-like protein [Cricetulus griseus]|nr:GTPase 1-like protein [Cricetulus griseus]
MSNHQNITYCQMRQHHHHHHHHHHYYHHYYFETGSCIIALPGLDSLCRPGWPGTHIDLLAGIKGRNSLFQELLGLKPHLLVLNKMDLADLTEQQKIVQHLEGKGLKNVIFTNCVKDENIKQIIPKLMELIKYSYRYNRAENMEYCVMVIGVPNVGKSSLINSLRRQHLRTGKATRVGGEPGITRAVTSRIQVCERPLTFLLDTPGVLAPRIESVETGLKLALCGTVLDHLVGEETMADYLLYTLNRHGLFGYVQHYGLASACDHIEWVLKNVAVKLGKTRKVKVLTGTGNVNVIQPDYAMAARDFLRTFRSGLLGQVMLDRDLIPYDKLPLRFLPQHLIVPTSGEGIRSYVAVPSAKHSGEVTLAKQIGMARYFLLGISGEWKAACLPGSGAVPARVEDWETGMGKRVDNVHKLQESLSPDASLEPFSQGLRLHALVVVVVRSRIQIRDSLQRKQPVLGETPGRPGP